MAQHSHKNAAEFATLVDAINLYTDIAAVTGVVAYLGPDGAGATVPFDGVTATPNTMIPVDWSYTDADATEFLFTATYEEMADEETAVAIVKGVAGIADYVIRLKVELDALNTAVQAEADYDAALALAKVGIDRLSNQSSHT